MAMDSNSAPRSKRRKLSSNNASSEAAGDELRPTPAQHLLPNESKPDTQSEARARITTEAATQTDKSTRPAGELDLEAPITPVKRGPGRPRKSAPSAQSSSTEANSSASISKSQSEVSIARRGRPRKSDSNVGSLTQPNSTHVSTPPQPQSRRRSERMQVHLDHQTTIKEDETDVHKPPTKPVDVVDNRKRHANGKPMGRPRKSDIRSEQDKSPRIIKLETDSPGETIANSIPKRKPGRPRKEVTLTDNTSIRKQEKARQSSRTSKNEKTIASKKESSRNVESDTISQRGPKKIKLKFDPGPPKHIITHPAHMPIPQRFSSLTEYLESYVALDDDVSHEVAKQRRTAHAALVARVSVARAKGFLDSDESKANLHQLLKSSEPNVSQTYHDHLNSQASYFSKLMHDERKRNLATARKIAAMIVAHFKRLSGAEERQSQELQRHLRQLAKRTVNEVRRRWRLAEKVVQRRFAAKLQEEQRAAGKEHLNQILEHSTSLLDARINSKLDDDTFSDEVSDGNDDHYLSVEQLREKYANLPEIESASGYDTENETLNSQLSSRSSVHEADEDQPHGSGQSDDTGSAMDSEDDVGSELASEDEENPGLAFLYPELARRNRNSTEPSPAIDSSSAGLDDGKSRSENGDHLVTPSEPKMPRRRGADELQELASDDEVHNYDEDDDSPMDSEMDESDDSDSDMQDGEEDSGPGLSWLYTTPIERKPVEQSNGTPRNPTSIALNQEAQTTTPLDEVTEEVKIKTPIPSLLRGTLREYQHTGLDWMAGLYLNGTNGILADEMGLGKTIQTISLLTWLACEQKIWGTHLVIVPTSVMLNWEMEFKKFAPGLKVLTYYGNPKERKEKRRGWSKDNTVHVVITSYQLVITDAAVFRRKHWEYMILDEAHNIKNFKSQRWQTLLNFNTQHRLLLTGTPLQNNLNELWSLLYFLMPQGLSESASFANLTDFQDWFGRPVDKLIEEGASVMNEEARNTVAKLHRILRPYILRRLKADVEKQMPGKYEHVVDCRLSKRQRYLYDDFMSRSGTRAIMASGNFLSIINCFMQLRKVCNHPDLFESRPIVTSLAMRRSVVAKFETQELLIRRRLLREEDADNVDLCFLNLKFASTEHVSKTLAQTVSTLGQSKPLSSSSPPSLPVDSNMSISQKSEYLLQRDVKLLAARRHHQEYISALYCSKVPIYGSKLITELRSATIRPKHVAQKFDWMTTDAVAKLRPTFECFTSRMEPYVQRFACVTPKVVALDLPQITVPLGADAIEYLRQKPDSSHYARTSTSIAFPDKRLLQFDCGKLQRLDSLLRHLIAGGHRVLIFTQMTKMLDILEQFLNIHGHRYFRLDGSTKIEARQSLTEQFNRDIRIPIFILSTRSGGLGINLTGADTVIFYDSDWNPCMDRQCQDRAHRIGQTRDVHIYRFVSEFTIEQNIMRKANQKRMLDNVVIGEGDFTTDFFNKVDWKDMLGEEMAASVQDVQPDGVDLERALAAAEDEDDAQAARTAQREMDIDAVEFAETGTPKAKEHAKEIGKLAGSAIGSTPKDGKDDEDEEMADEGEDEPGSIDDYMITFLERELAAPV